jgi:hypothetical protein
MRRCIAGKAQTDVRQLGGYHSYDQTSATSAKHWRRSEEELRGVTAGRADKHTARAIAVDNLVNEAHKRAHNLNDDVKVEAIRCWFRRRDQECIKVNT